MSERPRPLFREEAVAHHARRGLQGDVLHLTARSFFWVHWLLLVLAFAAVVFSFIGQLDEYAAGPAMVRIEGRTEVTAPIGAVVQEVLVTPGDRVKAGDPLLRFDAAAERAELLAAERELAGRLSALLREPADAVAREAVSALRARRDLGQAAVEQKTVLALQDGIVGDVRIREGQLVEPGMPLLSLLGPSSSASIVALLPGRYLPRLVAGTSLRMTIDGFERDVQALRIERVSDQIIGPGEAARYLGRELGDAFGVQGPVVLVHARLPGLSFTSRGTSYRYSHGMHGRAEAVVRRQSIVAALFPDLAGALPDVL